jgi:hypothetical protein
VVTILGAERRVSFPVRCSGELFKLPDERVIERKGYSLALTTQKNKS